MLLIDNLLVMKRIMHEPMIQALKIIDATLESSNIQVLTAKNGMPTLAARHDTGEVVYIHSSYDPWKEAESFINRMEGPRLDEVEHVFFYGIGLGYHIEAFCKKFPDKNFTIYEPNPAVMCQFLSTRPLSKFPLKKMHQLFIEFSEQDKERHLNTFFWNKLGLEKLLFVTLPSYERVFKEDFETFSRMFVEKMKDSVSSKATQVHFEKRWTVNSMLNFRENLVNPSIFDCDPAHFRGKPAVLAAAGPSLSFEMEHLRRIREENLAFVVTVGSAIKALLSQGIHPHAAATMDPGGNNILVFEDVINQGIDDIPLIYGTSVGYETLVRYPGKKLYMVMNRDNTTPYYFGSDTQSVIEMVGDAPTIAITTLQLLIKLGCDPIILAGQNLALYDNSRYAEGVKYSYRKEGHKATEGELAGTVETEDVFGNKVPTFQGWVLSRRIMEGFIASCGDTRRFFNTTRFGANIEGAPYTVFDDLFDTCLREPAINDQWYVAPAQNKPDKASLEEKDRLMNQELETLESVLEEAESQLSKIGKVAKYGKSKTINDELLHFDAIFKKIASNRFYVCFLAPMLMVELSIMNNRLQKIRAEKVFSKRGEQTVDQFTRFLSVIKHDIAKYGRPIYARIREAIAQYVDVDGKDEKQEAAC